MEHTIELVESSSSSSSTIDTLHVTSSDFGMRVIAYRGSLPTKPQIASSVEEAVGKLLFGDDSKESEMTATYEILGAKVITAIRNGTLAMKLELFSSDSAV